MSNIDYNDLDGGSAVARGSAGLGRRIGIIGIGLVLAGGLIYINWPSGPADKSTKPDNEVFETNQFSPRGLPESTPATPRTETIVIPDPAVPTPQQSADVNQTIAPGVDLEEQRRLLEQQMREQEAQRQAEAEARRREEEVRLAEEAKKRAEAAEKERQEALKSNQLVMDGGEQTKSDGAGATTIAADGQVIPVPGSDSDPNKAFLAQAEVSHNAMATATRNNRTDALISEGTMIRGFLETAINTDLPGMVRAVVREDVYSLDSRRILIPKGSRLTGEYKSGLARGQTRVFIVWNRMIRSDGVSVNIGSPGADSLGRAGLSGKVDNHWWARFGSAIMLSMVGGVSEYLSNLGDDDNNQQSQTISRVDPITGQVSTITIQPNQSNSDARQIGFERASNTMTELATEAFKDSRSIPPTIYVDQGTPVVVFVRRDLDFSRLYADPVQEELARLKRGGKPRHAIDPAPLYMTPKDNWYPAAPMGGVLR